MTKKQALILLPFLALGIAVEYFIGSWVATNLLGVDIAYFWAFAGGVLFSRATNFIFKMLK